MKTLANFGSIGDGCLSAQAKPRRRERGGEGGHSVADMVANRSAHFMAMD